MTVEGVRRMLRWRPARRAPRQATHAPPKEVEKARRFLVRPERRV